MPEIREDAHVPEGLAFDLANPLARDHELAADFLGGAAAPVHEAETQLEAALPDGRAASCALLTGSHSAPRPLRMRCAPCIPRLLLYALCTVHSRMLNGRRAILLLRVVIGRPMP